MLLTKSGFAIDFTNHLWLVWYQERFIEAHLHPTFFLNAQPAPAFSPQFLFYGATLYTLTAIAAIVLGSAPVVAFVGVSMAAIAAAYGGSLWLARQLGVRGLKAHAPALVYVTSAYYVTNVYGRGAWPEFIAVSMPPLLIAAALRLVRDRWTIGPLACLVASALFLSGSHNITLLWSGIFFATSMGFLWLFAGRYLALPWRRMVAVGAVGLAAVGLNSWFLLPDVVYAHDTLISQASYSHIVGTYSFFDSPGELFDPLRYVPKVSTSPGLFVQAPVWFLAWALVAGIFIWVDRRSRSLRGPLCAMLIVLAGFLALVMAPIEWGYLPAVLSALQFPYRLNTYVALACAALVLIGVLAMQRQEVGATKRRVRGLQVSLALVSAGSIALCAWQLWVPNVVQIKDINYPNRNEIFASSTLGPRTWYAAYAFADGTLPVVQITPGRALNFPPEDVSGERFSETLIPPPGTVPFATNLGAGLYFIHVKGLRVVGRMSEGPGNSGLVLARTKPGAGPVHVEVTTFASGAIIVGRLLTLVSALALLALGAVVVIRRNR